MTKRSPLTFKFDKKVIAPKAAKPQRRLEINNQTVKQDNKPTERKLKAKVGRSGRQIVATYVLPEAAKQLKLLAVNEGRTCQNLLVEAMNDLFAKYGLSRIADE